MDLCAAEQAGVDGQLAGVLFDLCPEPLVAVDEHGRVVAVNAALRDIVGPAPNVGTDQPTSWGFVDAAHRAELHAQVRAVLAGRPADGTIQLVGHSGATVPAEVVWRPVAPTGRIRAVAMLGICAHDDEVARPAVAQDRQLRELFDTAQVAIAITDLDGRIVDANRACLATLGYTLSELRQLDVLAVIHPDDRDATRDEVTALLAGEVAADAVDRPYLTRTGEVVWGQTSVSHIHDGAGVPVRVAAIVQDVTAPRAAQTQLQHSLRLQRLAGSLARVGGWSLDADGMVPTVSPARYEILEVTPGQEPAFEQALDLIAFNDRPRAAAAIQACMTDGTPFELDLDMHTLTGRWLPVRAIGELRRDAAGTIVGVIGAFQDVGRLQAADHRARQAARQLRANLESMTDAFLTLDRQWQITYLNARAGQLLRKPPGTLVGRVLWEALPEAVDTDVHSLFHQAMASGATQEIDEFHCPPLDTWFSVIAYPSDQGLAVYFRDVTQARRDRQALRDHEAALQRQAALLDEAQDAILVCDLNGHVTSWNRGAQRIYGWAADEVLGADVRELVYDDPAELDRITAEVMEHGSWVGRLTHHDRAGNRVVVAGRWTLLRDDHGQPDAVLAINTDITQWQKVEQQLLRTQRMESIGFLASGVAHDLNNILAPILLACDLLRHRDDNPNRDIIELIEASVHHGTGLVRQILSFARGVEGERTALDIPALLDDLAAIIGDTFPKNIDLRLDRPDQHPPLVGDATQIQQVLLNLAVNARDAMPGGGTLTIRAHQVSLDAQYVAAIPDLTPGDYLAIDVEDSGTGMPPEVRDRIFEPFFTTKPHGAGTGLGLSTSHAIATSHGGFLQVDSDLGRGSRFRLYLPVRPAAGTPDTPASKPAGELPRGAGQTILVVDDEERIRTMASQTLQAHGYQTLQADHGTTAVSLFAQHRDVIDAVIIDSMMPIMDGPATIRALHDIHPELPIIGTSGLHDNGTTTPDVSAGVHHFLPKPYTARSLLETLQTVLTPPAHRPRTRPGGTPPAQRPRHPLGLSTSMGIFWL